MRGFIVTTCLIPQPAHEQQRGDRSIRAALGSAGFKVETIIED